MIDLQQAEVLEREAEQNGGHCSHCHQTIKIYRYGVSDSMVRVLKAMAKATHDTGSREIDADKLDLKHSERTQLTKMRFHALIAKVKVNGVQKPRHWIITTKGWDFLGGAPIPAKVLIFNNQVLGHDGGTTTINRIYAGNGEFEQEAVTEPEARVYSNVRQAKHQYFYEAEYRGNSYSQLGPQKGKVYAIRINTLQMGKPVSLEATINDTPYTAEYRDIASFSKWWKIIKP